IGLFRIFQESLTNVARHSGAKKVIVNLTQKDKKLILTIRDNGEGFDDEKVPKKTLGLLGMKERTLMMGGQYSISGIRGEGTTVTVIVPLSEIDP
ncbi:MAG TPA: ATP-binding protein, partial [Chitinophagaceae bacterium]|nr:ATP-binding protein [Chitinophagaceae bacterium]